MASAAPRGAAGVRFALVMKYGACTCRAASPTSSPRSSRSSASGSGRPRDHLARPGHRLLRATAGRCCRPCRRSAASRRSPLRPRRGPAGTARHPPGKLTRENGSRSTAPGRRHRRRQHGVHERRAGGHRSRRRGDPADPVLLQSRDGDDDDRVSGGGACRPTTSYQLRSRWHCARPSRRGRGRSSRSRRTIRPARCTAKRTCAAVNALCARARDLCTSPTRRTSTSRTAARGTTRRADPGEPEAHTISLFSLSKAYGFASWRIGYMVMPDELFDAVNKIQDTILICPPHGLPGCRRRCAARRTAVLRAHVARSTPCATRCTRHSPAIADSVDAPATDGAFYVLLRVRTATTMPTRLTRRLIESTRWPWCRECVRGDRRVRAADLVRRLDRESVAAGMGRLVEGLRAEVG